MPVTEEADGEFTTELGTTYADDPVLGIVENLGLGAGMTEVLEVYVGILAAVILLIATNAALIGVSRLTYSMGQHRQLPERLRQVHPRFRTPYIAILVFSAVARSLTVVPGETDLPGDDVLVRRDALVHDRARLGDPAAQAASRPASAAWKPPLNVRVRGVEVPLTAVLGGLGTFGALVVVMALDPVTLPSGGGWMVFGHGALRRSTAAPAAAARPRRSRSRRRSRSGSRRSSTRACSSPSRTTPFSRETVATAVEARRRRGAGGSTSSRWSPCPRTCRSTRRSTDEESEAQSKIEQAKLIGGLRVTGHVAAGAPRPGGPRDRRGGGGDQGGARS